MVARNFISLEKKIKLFYFLTLSRANYWRVANMEIKIINKIIFVVVFQTFCGNKFQDLGEFFVF